LIILQGSTLDRQGSTLELEFDKYSVPVYYNDTPGHHFDGEILTPTAPWDEVRIF